MAALANGMDKVQFDVRRWEPSDAISQWLMS
jgi:hypothetical protein